MKLKDWKQKSLTSKIFTVIGLIISITIVILALLQIFNVWDKAINIFEPLLGLLMLIQAIENWNTNRSVAYFSLFAAIFVLIMSILILF
jgi:hypothetical protein